MLLAIGAGAVTARQVRDRMRLAESGQSY
jgi:hypothetical protein